MGMFMQIGPLDEAGGLLMREPSPGGGAPPDPIQKRLARDNIRKVC